MPSDAFPPPGSLVREPEPGDVYEFTVSCSTIAGHALPKGTKLTLVEWTQDAPFNFKDPAGNWLVDGPNGRTVWSSIRHGIQTGILKLVMQLKAPGNDRSLRFNRLDKDIV